MKLKIVTFENKTSEFGIAGVEGRVAMRLCVFF